MVKSVLIKDPGQIPTILDIIHDRWFDKDDVLFDSKTSILSIKFKQEDRDKKQVERGWFLTKTKLPLIESFLKFHHVKSYTIDDKANVGSYDFNTLEYDPKLKRITVNAGVPLSIEIIVSDFEVFVEETDKVVGVRTRKLILGGIIEVG